MYKTLLLPVFMLLLAFNGIDAQNQRLLIIVGERNFTATLNDNETVDAFVTLLPLDIDMSEMGGYEKFHYLPQQLPGSAYNVDTTYEGDLMIWSSNCLVLFYTTRSTSYSYIRLGRIDDTTGLREALGSGNVRISFRMEGNGTGIEKNYNNNEMHKVLIEESHLQVSGEVDKLALYTVNGTVAANSNNNMIATGNLHSGIYLLRIQTKAKDTIIKKVILN